MKRTITIALAVALLGLVVAVVYDAAGTPLQQSEQDPRARAESTHAYEAAMWGAAGLAFVGAAVAGLGLSRGRSAGALPAARNAPPPPPASSPTP